MIRSTFIRTLYAVSAALDGVSTSQLPDDIRRFAEKTGTQRPFLPRINSTTIDIFIYYNAEWKSRNTLKSDLIDMNTARSESSIEKVLSWQYAEQRDVYVVAKIGELLHGMNRTLPDDLVSFLGIRRSRSKEK